MVVREMLDKLLYLLHLQHVQASTIKAFSEWLLQQFAVSPTNLSSVTNG
jgi:hypothetical protein